MPVQGNAPKSSMTDKHLPGMKLMHRTDKAGEALSRSPKRRSRLASLIESDPRDVDASVKYRHASNNELDIETRQRSEHEQILVRLISNMGNSKHVIIMRELHSY